MISYSKNDITIHNTDCVEFLKSCKEHIKLVFADPPYNNKTKYDNYDDNRNDYKEWCKTWFYSCKEISDRIIVTPGHGNLWMWGEIEKPMGIGCWFKPGNPASSVLGWCCWEPWLYWSKDRKVIGGPDSFRWPITKQQDTFDHPCPKPVELLKFLIEKTTKKGDLVFDPFLGSGTTAMACLLTNRRFIGTEQSTKYFNQCKKRIQRLPFFE